MCKIEKVTTLLIKIRTAHLIEKNTKQKIHLNGKTFSAGTVLNVNGGQP